MAIVGEDAWNERVKLFWNGEVVVRKVEVVRADRSDIFWRGVSEGSSSGSRPTINMTSVLSDRAMAKSRPASGGRKLGWLRWMLLRV